MPSWGPLALTTITAALLALPVTPALYELWKRADATPLPSSRHDGHITNFAETFRSRLEPLRTELEICSNDRQVSRTRVNGMEILLVGVEDFAFDPQVLADVSAVMLSHAGFIPEGRVLHADVYANRLLQVGEHAAVRAALSRREILLRKDSAVLRWLHADGSVLLEEGSAAFGRISAGQAIYLEPGCSFQRMHSPHIVTVDSLSNIPPPDDYAHEAEIPPTENIFAGARPRLRVRGNFVLPAGETMNANVIATGDVRFEPSARLIGSIKSYRRTLIGEKASVHGSIVSGENVHVGARAFVAGPVTAESDVLVAQGSQIGKPGALTTVSSSVVHIATGCRLHGTVWARIRGMVEA